jgi:arylformamidase
MKNGIFEESGIIMKLILDESGSFVNTNEGIDISISFGGNNQVNSWYLDDPKISPVQTENFIGAVAKGAPVNFNNIYFNPHAHVTHTEGLGHITKKVHSVNQISHPLFYWAQLISVSPEIRDNGDQIITIESLESFNIKNVEALIIRTLPNYREKKQARYSHSNPPFIDVDCAKLMEEKGIQHLLIDLPSVDKEQDGGELAFHHAFWKVPENPNHSKTITEFIYVPTYCLDGEYLMNLQVAPIENDASPSRPVLYKIHRA